MGWGCERVTGKNVRQPLPVETVSLQYATHKTLMHAHVHRDGHMHKCTHGYIDALSNASTRFAVLAYPQN